GLCLFGGNSDDTSSAFDPEYSQRGRVFQHFNGFDIIWIEIIDVVIKDTIHDIEGVDLSDTDRTPDTNIGLCSRSTVVDDVEARHLTLEGGDGVGVGFVGYFLAIDLYDGAGEIPFAGLAISDDHYLIHYFFCGQQPDIDDGLTVDGHFLRLISNIRYQ